MVDACDLRRDMQETISDEKKASVPMFFVASSKKKRLERGLGFRAWILRL